MSCWFTHSNYLISPGPLWVGVFLNSDHGALAHFLNGFFRQRKIVYIHRWHQAGSIIVQPVEVRGTWGCKQIQGPVYSQRRHRLFGVRIYKPDDRFRLIMGISIKKWSWNKCLYVIGGVEFDAIILAANRIGITFYQGVSWKILGTLWWRHYGCDGVSNHQPHHCLLNRLFRRRSKKTSKLRVTGLCVGNSPGTGEFPAKMTSNAENVSIWWCHHVQNGTENETITARKTFQITDPL